MRSDASPRVKGYEVFFGFREPPFSLAPDPRFLFDSASHAAAREQVGRALERREPLVVVTGEIGTGKTLLCRSVVQKLASRTFLSIVHDPMLDRDELLKQMLQDFGVISKDRTRLAPTTRHELVHALQEFLLSLIPLKAHAVLVIDEAQHLQPDAVEQLRLVSNVHDDAGTLLQIVLVGQPSLEAVLARPELRQVKQRVSRHVRLEPLGIAELSQYIDHRLAVAREGGTASHGAVTFAPEALSALWRLSGGTPRILNLLCDRALEAAYEQQARSVGAPHVEAAAEELGFQAVSSTAAAPAPTAPASTAPARVVPAPIAPDGRRRVRGGAPRLSGGRSARPSEERHSRCRRRGRHRRGRGVVPRSGGLSPGSAREHVHSRGAPAGRAAAADGTAARGRARACFRTWSGFNGSGPAARVVSARRATAIDVFLDRTDAGRGRVARLVRDRRRVFSHDDTCIGSCS